MAKIMCWIAAPTVISDLISPQQLPVSKVYCKVSRTYLHQTWRGLKIYALHFLTPGLGYLMKLLALYGRVKTGMAYFKMTPCSFSK